jgi:hypothetical protein
MLSYLELFVYGTDTDRMKGPILGMVAVVLLLLRIRCCERSRQMDTVTRLVIGQMSVTKTGGTAGLDRVKRSRVVSSVMREEQERLQDTFGSVVVCVENE